MTEGDVALIPLPQADGCTKPRPVVLPRSFPPFGDWLVCGVSTRLQQAVPGFANVIELSAPDFDGSGLKAPSVIRLGFLASLPARDFLGVVGSISPERHGSLLRRLASFLIVGK